MKRPVSITLIAVLLFLGVAVDLRTVLFYPLQFHFVSVLGFYTFGYGAVFAYLLSMQVRVVLGIGLLQLKPWARVGTVGLCIYAITNALLTVALPGSFARYLAAAERTHPGVNFRGSALAMTILHAASIEVLVGGVAVSPALIYFLVTRGPAFKNLPPSSASSASGPAASAAAPPAQNGASQ